MKQIEEKTTVTVEMSKDEYEAIVALIEAIREEKLTWEQLRDATNGRIANALSWIKV